jgi:hypothetical protein
MFKKYFIASLLLVFLLSACAGEKVNKEPTKEEASSSNLELEHEVPVNPQNEVFWGNTHLHTAISMDAFIGGNRLTPADAYRFARGEEKMVNGRLHKLKRPLDFCAISDHAEFFGETYTLMNEGSPGYDHPIAVQMREADNYEDALALFVKYVVTPARTGGSLHPEFYQGVESTKSGWRINFEATEQYYEPGKFTTLHAFEWSAAPNAGTYGAASFNLEDVMNTLMAGGEGN